MAEIRVLLAAKPILNELIRETLKSHHDIASFVTSDNELDENELASRAAELGAQVVILDELTSQPSRMEVLLERRPRLKILTLIDDGREGSLRELRPTTTALGEMWPERLVEAIRAAAESRTWMEELT